MWVHVTAPRLSDAGFRLTAGASIEVPDDVASRWFSNGWATDPTGQVPAVNATPEDITLEPHNSVIGVLSKEIR